jgi:hypothetical protein
VAAAFDRDLTGEVEDGDLLPARRGVLALLSLGALELVAQQAGLQDAQVGPAFEIAYAQDLGGGEDGVAGEERRRVATRRIGDVGQGVVSDVGRPYCFGFWSIMNWLQWTWLVLSSTAVRWMCSLVMVRPRECSMRVPGSKSSR